MNWKEPYHAYTVYPRGLERAKYEIIDDEELDYGEVPELEGVWATGKTLEECCRNLKKEKTQVGPELNLEV